MQNNQPMQNIQNIQAQSAALLSQASALNTSIQGMSRQNSMSTAMNPPSQNMTASSMSGGVSRQNNDTSAMITDDTSPMTNESTRSAVSNTATTGTETGREEFEDDMDDHVDDMDDMDEGFTNKGALGFGIFTNNVARNVLRTALIVLILVLMQDKYVKNTINKGMKMLPLPKVMKSNGAICLIIVAIVTFLVLTFL